jgi:ribonuclease J
MKFKIHRGTKEIGGSCVEVWTDTTRILLDFGMPLVDRDGTEFNFEKYRSANTGELIRLGVLPDIKGLYEGTEHPLDAVIISHPHQDHYGLINFISKDVRFYMGEATHKIIEINNLFTRQNIRIAKCVHFTRSQPFQVGDFTITPYWADHAAFDSYSLSVKAGDKGIFYSGDFRNHGRKAKAFTWFTRNPPQDIKYLLLEGTSIGRQTGPFKTESEIEGELGVISRQAGKIILLYTSGQNIDRIVSAYRACLRTGRIMVVDVYVAKILQELSSFAGITHPSEQFKNLRVMFPYFTSSRLTNEGNEKILYQFRKFKITKEEISGLAGEILMIVRPSMQKDLERIPGIDGGNLIYSLWEGYMQKPVTAKFIDYLTSRGFTLHKIHTSGHADIPALKQMVNAIKPEYIIPIHTFNGSEYRKIFSTPVIEMQDGEVAEI